MRLRPNDKSLFPGLDMEQLLSAIRSDASIGFCRSCGEEAMGVEPDARNYTCESCGEDEVFGAEEVFIMTGGYL